MKNKLSKLLTVSLLVLVSTFTLSSCKAEDNTETPEVPSNPDDTVTPETPEEDVFGPHVRPDDFFFPDYEENLTIPKEENLVVPEFSFGKQFTTYMCKNESNISVDDYVFDNSDVYNSYTWDRTNFGYGVSQNTFFVYEHLIVLPTAGTYEFFIRANGDVRVYVSTNYNDYHLVAGDNLTTNTYDYYNENTFFKLSLNQNQPFSFKVVLNTSVRADFGIGTINESGKITDLANSYVALFN